MRSLLHIWKKILPSFIDKRKTLDDLTDAIIIAVDSIELKPKEAIGNFLFEMQNQVSQLQKLYSGDAESPGTLSQKRKVSEEILRQTQKGNLNWDDFISVPAVETLVIDLVKFIEESRN